MLSEEVLQPLPQCRVGPADALEIRGATFGRQFQRGLE
jgi:hypothetical protein